MAATLDPADLVDLYLRLSIDREGKDSLERQESDLREWASREGLTVRHVWKDRGVSGYKDVKRPDFDGALAALKAREVATLAVWKLDRLSRRGAGQIGLVLDGVERVGGRLVFLRDSIDTSNGSNNRMVIVMLSEQARAESANTSLRVRAKKDSSRKSGHYLGGTPPFGYTVDAGRKLSPHPDEAGLVRELVDRMLAGETLLAVCRDWNTRGVPTSRSAHRQALRRGKPTEGLELGTWRPSTLSAALRSPALAGLTPEKRVDTSAGGKYSTSTAPWRNPDTGETISLMADGAAPIVTESERVRLLAVMDSRLRTYGRGMKAVKQPVSLLGGLLVCASCGRKANTFGNSYRCRRWHENGTDCEQPLNVTISIIEAVIKRMWANGLAALEPDSPVLDAVADHWIAKYDPAPLEERRELVVDLAEARARIDAADDDHYVRATLDAERYARVSRGLAERIARITTRLSELPEPRADLGALLDPALSLPAIEGAPVAEARALLRLAIKSIEVTAAPRPGARFIPHERVRVRWAGETDAEGAA